MIRYVIGDATDPQGVGNKVIAHCCNDEGAWGSGFVVAVSKKWPEPEAAYLQAAAGKSLSGGLTLGHVQFVPVDWTVNASQYLLHQRIRKDQLTSEEQNRQQWVANIIGQQSTIRSVSHPVKYDAIWKGLQQVNEFCHCADASLHMPRMGAGLAGGSWAVIAALVDECCPDLDVTVYDLPNNPIPVKA